MKKLLAIVAMLPLAALAQKNNIKVNLSSLLLRNYNVTYERKLALRTTFSLGVRYMPKGKLPWQDQFVDKAGLDDPQVDIGRFEVGGTSITPEFRLYLSKKSMRGFYIAPYGKYSNTKLSVPLKYTYTDPNPIIGTQTKTAIFNGDISSINGGLMLGTQFSLGKKLVLDIWWVGGHYGKSNGDLDFIASLPTQQERDAVSNTLRDFDPSPFKYTYTVSANGAKIESSGPWAGFRGLGINLGFRF
jgi:hypothetical protein